MLRFRPGFGYGGRLFRRLLYRSRLYFTGRRRCRAFQQLFVVSGRVALIVEVSTGLVPVVTVPIVAVCGVVLTVEGFLFHHRFADGNRNLVIIRVNFREGQKAMAVSAVVYESGLQRGLDTSDFCEIDISAELFARCQFVVEFLNPVAARHHHPGLFRVGGVD